MQIHPRFTIKSHLKETMWWFVMFHGGSWHCDGLWWFMMICDVLWWFVIVCGNFSPKFSRKGHVTCHLTNQSPRVTIKSHLNKTTWWFVMYLGGLWCFVMVCDSLWWFFSKILKKRLYDLLFNQSESKSHYQISFEWNFVMVRDVLWWFVMFCDVLWWFVMFHGLSWCFVVVRDVSWWFVMFRGGSWCFMVFHGGFSPKFSRKGHMTCYLTNQSPRVTIKSHLNGTLWWFVMFCGGLWCFVVVHDVLWWFMMFHGGSWCFVVVCDISGALWCFVVVHDVLWWFVVVFLQNSQE